MKFLSNALAMNVDHTSEYMLKWRVGNAKISKRCKVHLDNTRNKVGTSTFEIAGKEQKPRTMD